MTQIRLEIDDYTKRVLDVVKGKHNLKNRNLALKKFVELHGEQYVEKEPNELFLKELDEKYENHKKKYGLKSIPLKQKTRDKLREISSKSESWDDILNRLYNNEITRINAEIFFSTDTLSLNEALKEIEKW